MENRLFTVSEYHPQIAYFTNNVIKLDIYNITVKILKWSVPYKLTYWTPGPQLIVLFWEILEISGAGAEVDNIGHWLHSFEGYTTP
jgi:hypothetical protein